ncbi:EAL domain-containing protein [Evansella sp. AB-rgal1]|uniref:EAL domain-containing protein n=1 Tax=Evansella sp. AB-rgal1 TaxID=3242696 RepID=UPI00359E6316
MRESTLTSILDSMEDGVIACDRNGKVTFMNQAYRDIIGENDNDLSIGLLNKTLQGQHVDKETYPIKNSANDITLIKTNGKQIRGKSDETLGALLVAKNITKEEQIKKALQESEQRYRTLVDLAPISIFVKMDDTLAYINQFGAEMIGANDPKEIIGRPSSDFIPPELRHLVDTRTKTILDNRVSLQPYETKLLRLDGKTVDVQANSTKIMYKGKEAILGMNMDITDKKISDEKIIHMAFHDPLTDLPNRRYFTQLLTQRIIQVQRNTTFGIYCLDLDNFKHINDWLNHSNGDKIIREVSMRLKLCVDKETVVARVSGDEFMIMPPVETDESYLKKLAMKILTAISKPFIIEGIECHVTSSIGISMYPNQGVTADTLVKNAAIAMFSTKINGKNSYTFFHQELQDQLTIKREMELDLQKALKQNEFTLYFQPQINTKTNTLFGVEALIRWQHPRNGLVSPNEFIPIAEESGFIVFIDEWVLREACKQIKKWNEIFGFLITVKVNLSAKQFYQRDLVSLVSKVLTSNSLPPSCLELEITESTMMKDKNKALSTLLQLNQLGVKLSLDDFGTGFSSLSYIKDFPIDTIKIDRSFIHNIFKDTKSQAIVKTIINLAHSLKLQVIAEGIETEEQAQFLQKHSCHLLQGFLYSKPIPVEELEPFIKQSKT